MKTLIIGLALTLGAQFSVPAARADGTEGVALGLYQLACTKRSDVWTTEIASMSELKDVLHCYVETLTKVDSLDKSPQSDPKWVSHLLQRFDQNNLSPSSFGLMEKAVALRKKLVQFAGADEIYRFDYYCVPRSTLKPRYNKLNPLVTPIHSGDFGGGGLFVVPKHALIKSRWQTEN
ncbi:unnamed protein product [Sphagnum balticum]